MNQEEHDAQAGGSMEPRKLMAQAWGALPGKGGLAVVASRPGLGKTALLVQVAVGDLMEGRKVLHVGIGQNNEHVQSWYDGLFGELCRVSVYEESDRKRMLKARHIRTYGRGGLQAERLRRDLDMLAQDAGFVPDTVILDGLRAQDLSSDEMDSLSLLARERNLELWVAVAVASKEADQDGPEGQMPRAVAALPKHVRDGSLVQVGLEPCSNGVCVLASARSQSETRALFLHPDTLLVSQG